MIDYYTIFSWTRLLLTFIATFVLLKYFIYLILAPFYTVHIKLNTLRMLNLKKRRPSLVNYKPLVSIVIPAWNEEVGIITTIRSVLNNTYENLEIIVVNDGSTDNTHEVVTKFFNDFKKINSKKTILYFNKENGGKGSALNYGISMSSGEIIVTMDADSAHHPKAMENLVKHFQNPSIQAVVGNVKVTNTNTLVGMIQNFEYTFGFYFKRVHSLFDAEYIFGGACAAFRKSRTFDVLGLFDTENKTEDIEYSMRVKLHGLKSLYAEDVIAYTEGASTLKGLYSQRLRWKKGRIDTFVRYRKLFLSRDDKHSRFLSWVVLPYALFGEFQMILEPIFFTAIWTYTFISSDYLSVGISSLFIFFTYVAAFVFGDKETNKLKVFSFPATWLMFHIVVAIEFLALIKSLELIRSNKDIVWQSWSRQGIGSDLKLVGSKNKGESL